jgi:hypothetical protein
MDVDDSEEAAAESSDAELGMVLLLSNIIMTRDSDTY